MPEFRLELGAIHPLFLAPNLEIFSRAGVAKGDALYQSGSLWIFAFNGSI
jgi:hypothetical protein